MYPLLLWDIRTVNTGIFKTLILWYLSFLKDQIVLYPVFNLHIVIYFKNAHMTSAVNLRSFLWYFFYSFKQSYTIYNANTMLYNGLHVPTVGNIKM